jgi:hypothetical protein
MSSQTTGNNNLTANLILEMTPDKLSQLENDVGYITEANIGNMGTTVANLQTTVTGLQTQVNANQAQSAINANSINTLNSQMTLANTNITSNTAQIQQNSQQLADFQGWGQNEVVRLDGLIAQNTTAITSKANVSDVPTKVSQLQNDSQFQTLQEVMTLLSSTQLLKTVVVDTKPTVDDAEPNTIYLVKLADGSGYEMYLLSTGGDTKELVTLGTTALDLTEYVTLDDLNTTIQNTLQQKLTEVQLQAVNSGINESKVAQYDGYNTTIASKANAKDVVNLSGAQSVAGEKTFTQGIVTNIINTPNASTALTIGVTGQGIAFSNSALASTTQVAGSNACGIKAKAIQGDTVYANQLAKNNYTYALPDNTGTIALTNNSEVWSFSMVNGTTITKTVGVFG